MILKYLEYITENFGLLEHDGILIIVDVQKEFKQFIPPELVTNIIEYCKDFDNVYQIWDTNKATKPTYTFPNQVDCIKKRYGKNYLNSEILKKLNSFLNKKEGEIVVIDGYDSHFVRINNNHQWFAVSKEMIDLFNKLKGKKVIIVGGSDSECIEDELISAKAFGVDAIYNHKYIYSAEDKQY